MRELYVRRMASRILLFMLALLCTAPLAGVSAGDPVAAPPRLYVLSVDSEVQNPLAEMFVQSALHHGVQLEILGVAHKAWWPDGLGFKIAVVRDRVMELARDSDIVLVADATDVSFFAGASTIIDRFEAVQAHETARRARLNEAALPKWGSVVFNAERWCYPDITVVIDHPKKGVNATWHCPDAKAHGYTIKADSQLYPSPPHLKSPWRHLNSGGFIGRVGALKRLLAKPAPMVIPGGDQMWCVRNRFFFPPSSRFELPLLPHAHSHARALSLVSLSRSFPPSFPLPFLPSPSL